MPDRKAKRERQRVARSRQHDARPSKRFAGLGTAAALVVVLLGFLLIAPRLWRDGVATDVDVSESSADVLPYHVPPRPDVARSEDGSPEHAQVAAFRQESFDVAEEVVRAMPTSADAVCLLATVHLRHASEQAAHELWEACLKLDPKFADAYQMLGTTAMEQGDYAAAEAHLRRAWELSPQWTAVPLPLAESLLFQGKLREARVVLEQYCSEYPDDVQAWCRLGDVHRQGSDLKRARQCYESALRIDPHCADACYSLSLVLTALGQDAEAAAYREQFTRMSAESDQAVRALRPSFDDVWRMRTTLIVTHLTAARVYLRHGQADAALDHCRRVAELDGDHRESRELMCRILEQQHKPEAALSVRRELCRIAPDDPQNWLRTGLLHYKVGQVEEAERDFRQLVKLAPEQAEGYLTLAQILMEPDKDPNEAVQLACKGVELDPTAENYHILATVYQRVGDVTAAQQALMRAVQLEPHNPRYRQAHQALREQRRP